MSVSLFVCFRGASFLFTSTADVMLPTKSGGVARLSFAIFVFLSGLHWHLPGTSSLAELLLILQSGERTIL